ncbi:calcipressin-1 [Patella vulgata]|uniref:calcipressin-1 n=1 Tax=Patella vulgata TaxID=6465 RepID=UPI00217F9B44|nr:calcipressin-1 [Patella vulgata]
MADHIDVTDLPDALIITNVDVSVFVDDKSKSEFESVFLEYDGDAQFLYLRNFHRARVNFSCPERAAKARIHQHETHVCGSKIKCYFAQLKESPTNDSPHLHPPKPDKQFLISPPASPPVGWEQMPESNPVINYDLLAAMAQLAPGQAHELHPATEDQPGIVVHICEDPKGYKEQNIVQTKCPDRST